MGTPDPDPLEERFLSNEDIAAMFDVPLPTVRSWRARGTGPRGYRVGGHVRYAASDVREWLNRQADPVRGSAA